MWMQIREEILEESPCEICREYQGCALLICRIPYDILPLKHIFYIQNLIKRSASLSRSGCQSINIHFGKFVLGKSTARKIWSN